MYAHAQMAEGKEYPVISDDVVDVAFIVAVSLVLNTKEAFLCILLLFFFAFLIVVAVISLKYKLNS